MADKLCTLGQALKYAGVGASALMIGSFFDDVIENCSQLVCAIARFDAVAAFDTQPDNTMSAAATQFFERMTAKLVAQDIADYDTKNYAVGEATLIINKNDSDVKYMAKLLEDGATKDYLDIPSVAT